MHWLKPSFGVLCSLRLFSPAAAVRESRQHTLLIPLDSGSRCAFASGVVVNIWCLGEASRSKAFVPVSTSLWVIKLMWSEAQARPSGGQYVGRWIEENTLLPP